TAHRARQPDGLVRSVDVRGRPFLRAPPPRPPPPAPPPPPPRARPPPPPPRRRPPPLGGFPPAAPANPAAAQQQEARRITIAFENTPIADVASAFADFAGRSIVLGSGVTGTMTAQIDNTPWDRALEAILGANGLIAREMDTGIIRIEDAKTVGTAE